MRPPPPPGVERGNCAFAFTFPNTLSCPAVGVALPEELQTPGPARPSALIHTQHIAALDCCSQPAINTAAVHCKLFRGTQ